MSSTANHHNKPELAYHKTRFASDDRREALWKTLCESYFNRLIPPDATVLELGAGYCNFINNIRCKRRFAVDMWPGIQDAAQPGVRTIVGSVTDLSFVPDASVDFAFASNLFEHLAQADFALTLCELRRTLSRGGSLNILQPNYKLAYREYFDDYTHVAIYSDTSICDFLAANGFRVIERHPGFLPFSIKSRWPVSPFLIRLYLASPVKPFAKQMLIRAVPE
jgi:ubiquinone/menaquinone biosynthesis C-methylase UbiE